MVPQVRLRRKRRVPTSPGIDGIGFTRNEAPVVGANIVFGEQRKNVLKGATVGSGDVFGTYEWTAEGT